MSGDQSHNFYLLEPEWPELYKHAVAAEKHVNDDPEVATIKLRCFVESLVGQLYRKLELPSEPGDGLYEKIKSEHFEAAVDSAIRQKLHAIRYHGNKAAHGNEVDSDKALQLLKEAYLLGHWLFSTYNEEVGIQYPEFVSPRSPEEDDARLEDEKKHLAELLEEAKKELSQVQSSEEESQAKISVLNTSLHEARMATFREASSRAASSMDLEEENTRRLLKIEDTFSEYTLTDGQSELVKQLGEFLSSNTESSFILRGYAGTGKTFITKGLTEHFRAIGRNYVLAAPTGKAAKVIAEKTKSPAFTIHRTIYSFKDISEYKDHTLDGSETYKFYAKLAVNELPADTVFIVDEASMVSDVYSEAEFFRFGSGYLLSDFLKYVNLDHNDHRKKVIFIGDDAQLPPVGMSFSPALAPNYLSREHNLSSTGYELTEVVRQKSDSGVMGNSIFLRNALKKGVFNQISIDFQSPDIAPVAHADLMERYIESCDNKINGESIVIAYSNADVAAYNRRIREHFFPGREQVSAGDKVMAVSNSSAYGFFISNGDFGIIKSLLGDTERRQVTIRRKNRETGEVENTTISLAFKDVVLGFRDHEGTPQFFSAKVLEDLLYSDQPSLSSDENKALYVDFCIRHPDLPRGSLEFKNTLMSDPYFNALRLKFGYAVTCHKAQGSEWNNVFVKCKINQNQLTSAYFRWFYTAITRAKHMLWLLDPPNIKPWGEGLRPASRPGFLGISQRTPVGESTAPESDPTIIKDVPQGDALQPLEGIEIADKPPFDVARKFGIPDSAHFLLAILDRVNALIADSDIFIVSISHNQYQEAYTFTCGNESCRIDISYNGKEKVTNVASSASTEFSFKIKNLLSPMVGAPIAYDPAISPETISFDQEFLNQLHQCIVPLVNQKDISIKDVVKHPWSLRYSFVRGPEVAVFDIFFDGKHRFNKFQPLITACSPGQLVSDIEEILTQGLT